MQTEPEGHHPTHGDQWIEKLLESARPFKSEADEEQLIESLLVTVYQHHARRGLLLAAAFDLLIAAEYYRSVAHVGWLYCSDSNPPVLLYPYTNVCPSCVLHSDSKTSIIKPLSEYFNIILF